MAKEPRQTAISRLRQLPFVFELRDLRTAFEIKEGVDRILVHRWREAGLLQPVGPSVGLYFNLVRDPDGPKRRIGEAVRRRYPSAVVIGSSAIHAGGWTTQIPRRISIAIPHQETVPRMTGVRLLTRSLIWYSQIQKGLHLTHSEIKHRIGEKPAAAARGKDPMLRIGMDGLPTLHPAWALADQLKFKDDWVPDPDDLDNEAIDIRALEEAYQALGVKAPDGYGPRKLREGIGPRI